MNKSILLSYRFPAIVCFVVSLFLCLTIPVQAQTQFVPSGMINRNNVNVLMAVDGVEIPSAAPNSRLSRSLGGHGKFGVGNWKSPETQIRWSIRAEKSEAYQVRILLNKISTGAAQAVLSGPAGSIRLSLPEGSRRWDRFTFPDTFAINAGEQELSLTIQPSNAGQELNFEVLSVELVRPEIQAQQLQQAQSLRSDTTWLQEAGFGLMFHWTSQTAPLTGTKKSYQDAVRDFDVEKFADHVQQTDAKFVVLTTSHAQLFFPGPNNALDKILPGRTCTRDLVGEIAAALNKRGIRLMLYYHLGSSNDPQWQSASGFWKTDTTEFFDNWKAIISDMGNRYGSRIAGFWFDDGSVNYYYRSPDWKELYLAARAGYNQRLIGFNSWELPSPTPFEDLDLGEGADNPSGVDGLLVRNGNGRYPSSSRTGLQACATLIGGGNWVHDQENQPLPPVRWNEKQIQEKIAAFKAYKNVLIINLEISQEGEFRAPEKE